MKDEVIDLSSPLAGETIRRRQMSRRDSDARQLRALVRAVEADRSMIYKLGVSERIMVAFVLDDRRLLHAGISLLCALSHLNRVQLEISIETERDGWAQA